MCVSASVAQRRHIGLQQLEAIAATTHGFLGPNKRPKFIQDEDAGDAILVGSCSRLLENIELQGSVGQLLLETVQAQQKLFRSGTGTLVFLAGVWSRVALECLNRGISVLDIKTAMRKGLELCLEVCKQSAVNVEEVSCQKVKDCGPSSAVKSHIQDTEMRLMDVKHSQNIKSTLKHSRHFSFQTENTQTALNDVTHIAQAVSHGCDSSMRLVIKACKLQSENTENAQNGSLDVQKLITCLVPGMSEEKSSVFRGFVTLLSAEQASVVRRLQSQVLNIALVNGDLCEKYRHVGFNRLGNVVHVTDHAKMSGVSLEERWIENALGKLHEFSVDVVLVSGTAGVKLKDRALGANVLVIEGVKSSVLKDFGACTGAIPVSYVTQIDQNCVGQGVTVSQRRDLSGHNDLVAISVVTASTSLVTAIISSSVSAKLQSLEDQFWSCAHRLHRALADRQLLRGAGTTELLCIRQLHQSKQTEMENPQEGVVLELMAEAWMDYVSTLMMNSGSVCSKAEGWTAVAHQMRLYKDGEAVSLDADAAGVYDNVAVKTEAWRRALDLVFLVLQSDAEIITGVSEGGNVYKELMYL
ncbi:Bardet-Biedl syndrome 12 protein isoform X2 [Puntigrus tetrazona]|nr:Bardet-Biedl syndrome 12 protein isoform X2 [Puntigrus tetrazona]XP_043112653.1 Bardet-Biedl syndrome 12 protein isoform X2 [Puntigrus tetrazona]XP_043112654.1 Bardet-Biedl syndrome 12 protein isoform X2 [Puntigrus tetrazona]XP_043112655.1 Bardet-Biedl syndrome 12 protein isoform X2 [Puntigrus tetrazona]